MEANLLKMSHNECESSCCFLTHLCLNTKMHLTISTWCFFLCVKRYWHFIISLRNLFSGGHKRDPFFKKKPWKSRSMLCSLLLTDCNNMILIKFLEIYNSSTMMSTALVKIFLVANISNKLALNKWHQTVH